MSVNDNVLRPVFAPVDDYRNSDEFYALVIAVACRPSERRRCTFMPTVCIYKVANFVTAL